MLKEQWVDDPMTNWRKLLVAIIGALVVTTAVHADMMPMSKSDAECRQVPFVSGATDLHYANLSGRCNGLTVADAGLWSVQLLPQANADFGHTSVQHPQISADGAGNLGLCLYALIGLGLCRSAPYVKRLSFGFVPEWFHDGGPFQIGHSFAVSPESLCPAPACCFIQPVCTEQPLISQYRLRTIVSLWRKSQFTPLVLASRAPPFRSC
jgi:hypothetical protein